MLYQPSENVRNMTPDEFSHQVHTVLPIMMQADHERWLQSEAARDHEHMKREWTIARKVELVKSLQHVKPRKP